ncbi:hypothetical protein RUM44_001679 [Polyplax serrata]|uniref:Uncharacterized protein n=1 Tax=Polyplax serrata TaxID=468196 RepID=A0ABR1AKR1_POLSC
MLAPVVTSSDAEQEQELPQPIEVERKIAMCNDPIRMAHDGEQSVMKREKSRNVKERTARGGEARREVVTLGEDEANAIGKIDFRQESFVKSENGCYDARAKIDKFQDIKFCNDVSLPEEEGEEEDGVGDKEKSERTSLERSKTKRSGELCGKRESHHLGRTGKILLRWKVESLPWNSCLTEMCRCRICLTEAPATPTDEEHYFEDGEKLGLSGTYNTGSYMVSCNQLD